MKDTNSKNARTCTWAGACCASKQAKAEAEVVAPRVWGGECPYAAGWASPKVALHLAGRWRQGFVSPDTSQARCPGGLVRSPTMGSISPVAQTGFKFEGTAAAAAAATRAMLMRKRKGRGRKAQAKAADKNICECDVTYHCERNTHKQANMIHTWTKREQ